jgi:poly(A) polymerase
MQPEDSKLIPNEDKLPITAHIIPRDKHCISRTLISPNALKVLYRLRHEGFSAYLVGGGVRDLLLGHEPKDFDIVTNAKPDQIKHCFRNAVLVGRRFRLAHILFKDEFIEVSTFRAQKSEVFDEDELLTPEGMILRDNEFGSFEEDASRRDFTVNAIYYNIADFSLIDCHNGLTDLSLGILRVIGDPAFRYREDPVRMLRAARLSAKLGFRVQEESERPILELGHLLAHVPPARLFTETEKFFLTGIALSSYKTLRQYELFRYLFPLTEEVLSSNSFGMAHNFIAVALQDTDQRVAEGKPTNITFLMAVMLWFPLLRLTEKYIVRGYNRMQAMDQASQEILLDQSRSIAIPKRFAVIIRELWLLQERFTSRQKNKAIRITLLPRFRGAFDFLKLRYLSGEPIKELVDWWEKFYQVNDSKYKTRLKNPLGRGRNSGFRRKNTVKKNEVPSK